MMRSDNRRLACCLLAAISIGLFAPGARAVNIVLTFDSGASDSPSFDPTGANLQALMGAVETYWQDIIEASGTLNVTYYYDDLNDPNGVLADHLNQGTSGGKPTDCRIRVDTQRWGTERTWYFDPTPTNNSEFDMQQALVRDLTAGEKSDWYNGTPKDLLEASYRGTAKATAPADARNGYDLFSVLLHEMGHGLGMTGAVAAGETGDNDYDFDPDLVWGGTMAAESRSATDRYHLDGDDTLMFPSSSTGTRTLPSATDIFSIEAASNWGDTRIDLQRQDFDSVGGSQDWNTRSNWAGNQVPGSADDAFVRYGDNVTLSANGRVENLTVDNDSIVFTGGNKLTVDDTATVGTGTDYAAISVNNAAGELEAGTVTVNDGAYLAVISGGLIDAGKVNVETGGTLQAAGGTVTLSNAIKNNGKIISLTDTLTLSSAAAGAMDLDGTTGGGVLLATLGSITVTGELKDAFDGNITVGSALGGKTVSFSQDWQLGTGGKLDLIGDSGSPATVAGAGEATIKGDVTVEGVARFTADANFRTFANVDLPTASDELELNGAVRIDGGSFDIAGLLELNGQTTYAGGGTFTGTGTLRQDGNATVNGDTTIDVAVFNWDGGGASDTTVVGATFTINSAKIDTGSAISDGYDGHVTLFGGTLVVNTDDPWRLDGKMTLISGTVQGQDILVYGDLSASPFFGGTSNTIDPNVVFKSTSSASVGTDCTLTLNGQTTYDGNEIGGAGKLVQNGDATFTGNTTISVATYDWDGGGGSTTTIDPGVDVTINSTQIDTGNPATDGFDGTLNVGSGATITVNTSAAWLMEGTVNMTNAGATPIIGGSAEMVVEGTVAVSGPLAYISGPVEFTASAVVTVPASSELELNGATTFDGGSFTGGGTIQQDGSATVDSATTIDVDQYDMDGTYGTTTLTLNDHLTLNVTNVDTGNNVFNGTLDIWNPGRLIVNTPGAWTMAGTMSLYQNAHANQYYVIGSHVNITGEVYVTGQAAIGSEIDLSGTITLGDPGDFIQLGSGNANTISGGMIVGPGTVSSGGGSLTGYGTIGADVDFFSSADLLASGGTLTVSGSITTVGTIGTAAASGKLDVTSAWNTSVADQLQLAGGEVTGGYITNDGTTTGYGLITSSGFRNNGTLTASGGTLTLSTASQPDLDGDGNEDGVINTGGNTVHVTYAFGGLFAFNGQLNIGTGGLFRMDYFGLSIATAPTPGEVNLAGGTYLAPDFWQSSTLNVSAAPSTIDSDSRFYAGSTNTLNADLQLKNHARIYNGATFTGTGSLIVAAGATVDVDSGASLGVSVVNNGTLNLGASPGVVTIAGDFTQNASGVLNIEIAGTDNSNPFDPQFDELDVTGTAWLAGTLDVSLIGGFDPNSGDIFDVLTASAIVDGGLNLNDPTALFTWSLEAGDTILRLAYDLLLPGDVNDDNSVDNLDITPFVAALMNTEATFYLLYPGGEYWAADVNEDDSVDNLDITPFVALLMGGGAPVPEPAGLSLLALAALVLVRRR